jgi:hypothetical protein
MRYNITLLPPAPLLEEEECPLASGIYIATHARGEEEQTIGLERRRRGYGDDEAEWVLIWQMRR